MGTMLPQIRINGGYPECRWMSLALRLKPFSTSGCKQKEYFEELECAQELTSFFGGHRYFPQAIQAASKAVAITMLHRRDDEETLAEAYWILAELYAATDKMDKSIESMRKCLELIEPGAGVGHPTYNELLGQLEDTRKRNLLVATV
ncbi:unnamed protein product [Sphagnum balticum]